MSDSSSRLPARPSLEQLQKQARELLKQHRAGETAALELGQFRCEPGWDSVRARAAAWSSIDLLLSVCQWENDQGGRVYRWAGLWHQHLAAGWIDPVFAGEEAAA